MNAPARMLAERYRCSHAVEPESGRGRRLAPSGALRRAIGGSFAGTRAVPLTVVSQSSGNSCQSQCRGGSPEGAVLSPEYYSTVIPKSDSDERTGLLLTHTGDSCLMTDWRLRVCRTYTQA